MLRSIIDLAGRPLALTMPIDAARLSRHVLKSCLVVGSVVAAEPVRVVEPSAVKDELLTTKSSITEILSAVYLNVELAIRIYIPK